MGPSLELNFDINSTKVGSESQDSTRVFDVVEGAVGLDSFEEDFGQIARDVLAVEGPEVLPTDDRRNVEGRFLERGWETRGQ